MDRIYSRDMTTTSGGNVSVRDENDDIWITPARVDKGSLSRSDIVLRRPDGTFEGNHPPSSELPFHLRIYEARPDVRAVIHAHPGALVSFSICSRVPDTRLIPEIRNLCGDVAFAPYALPGSEQLGKNIGLELARDGKPSCVVLENHGVVVCGGDLNAAFQRFETLEFAAEILLAARRLGDVRYLDGGEIDLSRRAAERVLPERAQTPPTSLGKEARRQVCEFARRAYAHRLATSTAGSLSARIEGDSFVITPRRLDRLGLEPENLVIVKEGRCCAGQEPSRAATLHRTIYQKHPEINAIVNALPIHATAFSVTDTPLDTRTIPESYLFLKDVRTIPFEKIYADEEAVAAAVGPAYPVTLLQNNGALIAGRTMLDAFDRLEVLEATAAAILRCSVLGPIHPMSDEGIRELNAAFPSV